MQSGISDSIQRLSADFLLQRSHPDCHQPLVRVLRSAAAIHFSKCHGHWFDSCDRWRHLVGNSIFLKIFVVLLSRLACLLCVISSKLILSARLIPLQKARATTQAIFSGYSRENKTIARLWAGNYIHCIQKSSSNRFSQILENHLIAIIPYLAADGSYLCTMLITFHNGNRFLPTPRFSQQFRLHALDKTSFHYFSIFVYNVDSFISIITMQNAAAMRRGE